MGDLEKLNAKDRSVVLKAIVKKLFTNPLEFGKPLQGDLKGYYRLRAGDYRIIYRVHKREVIVYIVQVGDRKDGNVYYEASKRIL